MDSEPMHTLKKRFIRFTNFILQTLENEGIQFYEVLIDRTFEKENASTRKPNVGLLTRYLEGDYDLENSFVIGDRSSDMKLAKNLGAKGVFIKNEYFETSENDIEVEFIASDWKEIYEFLKTPPRKMSHNRKTNETDIEIKLNLDGEGKAKYLNRHFFL